MAPQREWFEKDYYKVLGVSDSATDKEIGKAYRKLAKQYHPDANPGSEDRFKEISAAYDVLGDAARRKEYDEVRRLGPAGNPFTNAAGRTGGSGFRVDDLGDLLGNIFGRGNRQGRAAGPARVGGPVSSAARIWRRACTCRSSMPSTDSPRRSISHPKLPATRAAALARRQAPSPRCVRSAVVGASSTTTRVSFPSASPARIAPAPAYGSSTPAPPAWAQA